MSLDHEAIYKAYAGTVFSISDDLGAFNKDGFQEIWKSCLGTCIEQKIT